MSGVRPPVGLPEGAIEPVGLVDAVLGYERALMADHVPSLDAYFARGDDTLRGDANGLLRGHDAIAAFRRGRGGAPQRTLLGLEVRPVGDVHGADGADAALVIAVFAAARGGRGQQTQLWQRDPRGPGGWVVAAAHVSQPVPALDTRIWRVAGAPLVPAVAGAGAHGPLAGKSVAVKDLFDIAGQRVGAGNPAYLAEAPVASDTAPAVMALLLSGAEVRGIAQTDEFAYSIAGRNAHYGAPPNPRVPGALPGGSSSGPASAVATGQADIGLGTDTAGSIRVPASYQGLWGLRTTHGAVFREHLLPLAPSFDTVGWLTRDAATLHAAATVSLPATRVAPGRFAVAPTLIGLLTGEVRAAFEAGISRLGHVDEVEIGDVDAMLETFRVVQAAEAWAANGEWVAEHGDSLGEGVVDRFRIAAGVTPAQEAAARHDLAAHHARLDAELGDRVLLLPAASSAAPSATATAADLDAVRGATLRLSCTAGITGRPALAVPLLEVAGPYGTRAPLGLCLVGPRGSDIPLIDLALATFF